MMDRSIQQSLQHNILVLALTVSTLMIGACDVVEKEADLLAVEGQYAATTFEAVMMDGDSVFVVDLLAEGAAFELSLQRQGDVRRAEGRILLPDELFVDSLFVPALPHLEDRCDFNLLPPSTADGVDTTFTGSYVRVVEAVKLAFDGETSFRDFPLVPQQLQAAEDILRFRRTSTLCGGEGEPQTVLEIELNKK